MATIRYELVIACALIVCALFLYLFYSNRFIAFAFNVLLKLWGWKAGSASVWIEFRSIHFSILSGRILLRDLHYHSSDLTARAVACQLEWRYWIRRPMEGEDLAAFRSGIHRSEEADMKYVDHKLPCRVHLKLRGLEVYLYNRVASFDHIISEMEKRASEDAPSQPAPEHSGFSIYRIFSKNSVPFESTAVPTSAYPPSSAAPPSLIRKDIVYRGIDYLRSQLPSLDPKELLPLSLDVSKLIVTCGNASTPSLLVFDAQKTEGVIGVVPSRSRYDIYKQVFDLKLHIVNAQLLPNEEYHGPMTTIGKRVRDRLQASKASKPRWPDNMTYIKFVKLWRKWSLASAIPRPKTEANHAGPMRTATQRMRRVFRRHEDTTDEIDYTTFEYAVERKLLEAPTMDITYYIDNVGFIPILMDGTQAASESKDTEPEWGIDIVIHGGVIKYGPWSDRQRADLQRAFFPPAFQDGQASELQRPGDRRTWPALKVFVEFRGTTTMTIPFREPSKNWEWDGKSSARKSGRRDPAHLLLKVSDGSTISYTMPMVPSPDGYEPLLEVHLDSVAISSSLNDTRFVEAESCRVRAELPSPLAWKAARQWTFGITLRTTVIFLLRDHINMFTDLSKDWSSGPTTPLHLWIPMTYSINFTLRNYAINLYANDFNIIDAPLQKDSNVLFSFRGQTLQNKSLIASDTYSPRSTSIPFSVEIPAVQVFMSLPKWNTHWSNDDELRGHLGRINLVQLDGSYTYMADVTPGNVEQLELRIIVDGMMYKQFGWTIRSFMVLRDNYFGGFTHFRTLKEHLSKRRREDSTGDPVTEKYRPGSANPFQVLLQLEVKNSTLVLPAGLLGYDTPGPDVPIGSTLGTCLIMQIPRLDIVLRTHDDFMEMNVDMPVVKAGVERGVKEAALFASPMYQMTRTMAVIDGLDIVANRLFGPQPHAFTYVCIWEIKVGDVKTSMSYTDAQIAIAASRSFGFTFSDVVNAPALELLPELVPDVTFISVFVNSVLAVWNADQAAIEVALPTGLKLQSNDLAGETYRKVTSVTVPRVEIRAMRKSITQEEWLQAGHMEMQMCADIYNCPRGWKESAHLQRLFLIEQDRPTGRLTDVLSGVQRGTHGRAVIQGTLYLPRIQLPRLHDTMRQPKRKTLNGAAALGLHHENVDVASDLSDIERHVSDLQRDAFIARQKPTGRPDNGEASSGAGSEGLSEGDESDDTDFVTMDDHIYPGAGTGASASTSTGDMCEHMVSSDIRCPLSWDQSPFQSVKAIKVWGTTQSAFPTVAPDTSHQTLSLIADADTDSEQSTTVRLRVGATRVTVIPFAMAEVVDLLMTEVHEHTDGPELWIDSVLLRQAASVSAQNIPSVLAMDVRITDVLVRSLQCQTSTDKPDLNSLGTASSIDMAVRHLHVTARQRHSDLRAHIVVGHCAITTSDLSALRSDDHTSLFNATTSGRLSFTNVGLEKSGDALRLDLDHTLMDVTHHAPASIIGIASSLSHATRVISPTLVKEESHKTSNRRLAAAIFQYASQKQLVDHFATTQPAYFVQQGRPHEVRTDPGFKMLLYIRTSLSDSQNRSAIDHYVTSQDAVDDDHVVVPCLARLLEMSGSDVDDARDVRDILERICPQYAPPERSENVRGLQVTLVVKSISFKILDPDGDAPSSVTVGPIQAHFDSNPRLVIDSTQTGQPKPPADILDFGEQAVERVRVVVGIYEVAVSIRPHMIDFVRKAAMARQLGGSITAAGRTPSAPLGRLKSNPSLPVLLDVVLRIQDVSIMAAADTLTLETGFKGFVGILSLTQVSACLPQAAQASASTSIIVAQVFARAFSTVEQSSDSDRGVLASLSFSDMKGNGLYRNQGTRSLPVSRIIVGVDSVLLSVPRSVVRLYRFVNEWTEKYLPKLDVATRELMSEIRRPPTATPQQPAQTALFQAQVQITRTLLTLQVMRGTWLSWQIERSLFDAQTLPSSQALKDTLHFGVKLASQAVGVSSTPDLSSASVKARVRLNIPAILVTGRQDQTAMNVFASMDQLHVMIKPSHLDTVLTVQQKFGQDFNDLMTLIQHTRNRTPRSSPDHPVSVALKPSVPREVSIKYYVHAKMRGLRIGLRGARSTLLLECEDIKGDLDNELGVKWQLRLSDAALSVAAKENDKITRHSFNRAHRSAFVVIDLNATGDDRPEPNPGRTLRLELSKVHAVLQPSSIAEIADFVNDLQVELRVRKEQRATEMAEIREKAVSVMRTFEVHGPEARPEPAQSVLGRYSLTFLIKNVGAAFPLVLETEGLPMTGSSRSASSTRAFLLSVKSIGFGSHMGESGQAIMKDLCVQFVSQFRPLVFSDYDGLNHATHNRMLYPEMTAQLRTETIGVGSRLNITADVSGFILDLDSSLPDYVFSTLDVYRHGKMQLERINPITPPTVEEQSTGPTELPAASICASVIFRSGQIRLHSASDIPSARGRTASFTRNDMTLSEFGTDIIKLPEVSVWMEYHGASSIIPSIAASENPCAELMFKSTIHSSQNTIFPGNILPFLSEFNSRLESRILQTSPSTADESRTSESIAPTTQPSAPAVNLRISVGLQIDKSKLEFTCQPDVNVGAGVHWQSGGFFLSAEPATRQIAFSGAVQGLAVSLRHGFLTEACASVEARNLVFSTSFIKGEQDGVPRPVMSLMVDTELVGSLRFSRLQDLLCFKAVWLDRIPTFNSAGSEQPPLLPAKVEARPKAEVQHTPFLTAVCFRVRKLNVDVDLGQSISSVTLELRQFIVLTRLTHLVSELEMHVENTHVQAVGNISGHADVPDFMFKTSRVSDHAQSLLPGHQMLRLEMTSGPLTVSLESELQELLRYRAEPVRVEISDDWSQAHHQAGDTESLLRLGFVVHGSTITAAITVYSIPRLMVYVDKFNQNLALQREGASRESRAFRIAQAPKPDNALSAVAEAMLQTARSRFSEAETAISYAIAQGMDLKLDHLQLALFPRRMDDTEMAQFIGRGIEAHLERIVKPQGDTAWRDLRLAFANMAVSRLSGLNHALARKTPTADSRAWLGQLATGAAEANIFGLPAMSMAMTSEERLGGPRVLDYDFRSTFRADERAIRAEDIYISLNVSLYSWLTFLRKNFAREMDDVRAATSAPATPVPVPAAAPLPPVRVAKPGMPMSPRDSLFSYTGSPRAGSLFEGAAHADVGSVHSAGSPAPKPASGTDSPAVVSLAPSQEPEARGITYRARQRSIERLTMRQLGEATPDVMHPFFMKKAGFSLEDALPQYVHEYATQPLEEIMKALLELYSKQLKVESSA